MRNNLIKGAALAALAVCLACSGAEAARKGKASRESGENAVETQQAYAAGKHMGRIYAAFKNCNDILITDTAFTVMKAFAGLNEAQFKKGIIYGTNDFNDAAQGSNIKEACDVAFALYGPGGLNVPGMIERHKQAKAQ